MTTHQNETSTMDQQENQVEKEPLDGLTLLRDQLLPNLLGEEQSAILYWAGKELARQYPLEKESDTVQFFQTNGFGTLTKLSSKKETTAYILTGNIVTSRLEKKDPSFSLEAGFLAQQYQTQQRIYTEASFEIDRRKNQVQLIVQTDKKSTIL